MLLNKNGDVFLSDFNLPRLLTIIDDKGRKFDKLKSSIYIDDETNKVKRSRT